MATIGGGGIVGTCFSVKNVVRSLCESRGIPQDDLRIPDRIPDGESTAVLRTQKDLHQELLLRPDTWIHTHTHTLTLTNPNNVPHTTSCPYTQHK